MNSPAPEIAKPFVAIALTASAVVAAALIGGLAKPTTKNVEAASASPTSVAQQALQDAERGADHIEPKDLVRELLAARGDVRVIDVREAAEFATWHLPESIHMTLPEVTGPRGAELFAQKPRLVVLCSNGPAHPAQAWLELRRLGHQNVRVLAGGLDDFKAKVLMPPSLRADAGAAEAKPEAGAELIRAFFLNDPKSAPTAPWATDPATLTKPTMVSPRWLHERLGKVAVLDVRSERDFTAWHVPGAQRLDLAKIRVKNGDRDHLFVANDQLAKWFGNLGIAATTPVVLYADEKPQDATMAAMALLRLGHRALAILEGGVLRWATERRPLTPELTLPTAATYEVQPNGDDFTITTDELAAAVRAGSTKVLDVRSPEFFRGDKSTEARPGHIPGAVNRLYTNDTERRADGQWLRERERIAGEYAALGLGKSEPITVSCRTGHTASHSWFVMRYMLGYENVRWYPGSWTEWAARTDLPAATGDGK